MEMEIADPSEELGGICNMHSDVKEVSMLVKISLIINTEKLQCDTPTK